MISVMFRSKQCKTAYSAVAAVVAVIMVIPAAAADPCGMVPPARILQQAQMAVPITRVGAQKTYVFHHNGVETMVLRPGFSGKVDEFGMLIPFPSAPSVRKVDDNIFPHIAAAIDPPEVYAWVRRRRWPMRAKSSAPSAARGMDDAALGYAEKKKDFVRVLRREAVGMYDVAVLEAGSTKALKVWMDSKGFRYPTGMEDVTEDYVRAGWVFVAIKTQVGQKAGVNPRPGMRTVNKRLPAGATFNGHVQAMGFRFRSPRLVVPMRLSAFNPGKLRNIVYVLTDGPRRINGIPAKYVVRQVSGSEIHRNITRPLPLRVVGGRYSDLQPWQKQGLKSQRDPTPHNGLAKDLFASDLQAIARHRLSNPSETVEKQLLQVDEALGLRGPTIDSLRRNALAKQRTRGHKRALYRLHGMTMTVIDGEFDRDVIARQNLTFKRYRMAWRKNNRQNYDSRVQGRGSAPQGRLYLSSIDDLEDEFRALPASIRPDSIGNAALTAAGNGYPWLLLVGGLLVIGVASLRRRRRATGSGLFFLIAAITVGTTMFAGAALAEAPSAREIARQLKSPDRAHAAMKRLVRYGSEGTQALASEALTGHHIAARGWAIVGLADVGSDEAEQALIQLHSNPKQPMLIRTWAAAARVRRVQTLEGLQPLLTLSGSFPAIRDPLGAKVIQLLGTASGPRAAELLLATASRMPQLSSQIAPAIVKLGAKPLVHAMVRAQDPNVRRAAASYLGSIARTDKSVAKRIARAYAFRVGAKQEPWAGGPLFLPALSWNRSTSRAVVGQLIRWHVWADLRDRSDAMRQIHNNLRSLGLARAAGYRSPGWSAAPTTTWLSVWAAAVGASRVKSIIAQQGPRARKRYAPVTASLN